ncbi:MAG TPA: helicase HerA-like domain-containing protein [Gaiellaceae bacterium]
MSDFGKEIAAAYATTGASIEVGKGVLDGKVVAEADVRLPLRSANRHGLIAGATGTGKTRTLQLLAEQLSALAGLEDQEQSLSLVFRYADTAAQTSLTQRSPRPIASSTRCV